jgi:cytochrome P450
MHRMELLYGPDSEEFVPERWENTDLERKIGFGFMPFHGGPRMCLGSEYSRLALPRALLIDLLEDFALSEGSYAIVKMIQAFPNLRLPPEIQKEKTGQEKQSLTILVSSAEGCKVRLD